MAVISSCCQALFLDLNMFILGMVIVPSQQQCFFLVADISLTLQQVLHRLPVK